MEIASFAQEEDGRSAARTLSDISIESNASAKAQNHPSFGAFKHVRDTRVKLMCSHGGKILPRPSDRKLRYVGGETRMISVPRHIHFDDILFKLTEIYGPDLALKYQLPEEDLDALVSVSSDEDLENMMEECDRLDATEGPSRLRVFVFSSLDPDAIDLSDIADPKISEQLYVDAVNAVQVEVCFRKNDDMVPADSCRNVDGLRAYGWNTTQTQESVSPRLENLQPQVFPLEKLLPSGNFPVLNRPTTNDVSGPITPSPHAVFIRERTALPEFASNQHTNANNSHGAGVGVNDFRDLESGESASSSASSHNDLYHRYSSHRWAPSSQKHSNVQLILHGNEEDILNRADNRDIENVRGQKGALDNILHATAMNVLPPRRIPDMFEQLHGIEAAGEAKKSNYEMHEDLPLSPGSRLQKQLQADRDLSKLVGMEGLQPRLNDEFRQPPQAFQHVQEQQQVERLPFYNPVTAFTQEQTLAGGHLVSDSLHAEHFASGEIHQLPQGTSALVFPTSSAPSSSPIWQIEIAGKSGPFSQQMKLHEVSMDPSVAFSQLNCTRTLYNHDGGDTWFASQSFLQEPSNSVFQTCSADISLPSKVNEADGLLQKMHLPTTAFSNQGALHDYDYGLTSQAPWLALDLSSFPFPSPQNSSQEEVLDLNSLQSSLTNASGITAKQLVGTPRTQNHEGIQDTLPFLSPYSLGLSLMDKPVQHENELFNTSISEVKVDSPPAAMGDLSAIDRVSDVLPSARLKDCFPAETSAAGNSISRSSGSLGELHQEDDDLSARGVELSLAALGISERSIKRNSGDTTFGLLQGLKSLKAQTLYQESAAYSSAVDGETEPNIEEIMDRDEENRATTAAEALRPTPFPAPTSLIEAWSTTSQSEHEQQTVMQHVNQEKDPEEMELSSTMEKDGTIEDSKSEIKEVDTFESAAERPTNPVTIAEAEAIARDLQVIRYCDLEELRELGSGTFGTVYHGKWSGTDVAIKRIKSTVFTGRPSERERLIADFWREAYILGQLHHPNVVAFYGVVPDGPGGTLATVTEYMVNGSLKQALQKKDRALDRRKRLLIAMDAAFGMEYLHGKNVVHFDIKCENLLVNLRDLQRPICKVGDLGLSKVKQQTMVSGGVRGTLPWMAPELLNGSSSLVSEKVDVFSFGIVLWELLTGEEPYANMHYGAIIGGIVNNTLRPPVPRWCDAAWKSLMEMCWSANPAERPTFSEIARSLRGMEAKLSAKGQAPTTG